MWHRIAVESEILLPRVLFYQSLCLLSFVLSVWRLNPGMLCEVILDSRPHGWVVSREGTFWCLHHAVLRGGSTWYDHRNEKLALCTMVRFKGKRTPPVFSGCRALLGRPIEADEEVSIAAAPPQQIAPSQNRTAFGGLTAVLPTVRRILDSCVSSGI